MTLSLSEVYPQLNNILSQPLDIGGGSCFQDIQTFEITLFAPLLLSWQAEMVEKMSEKI